MGHIKTDAEGNKKVSPDLHGFEEVTGAKTVSNDDNGKILGVTGAHTLTLPKIGGDKGAGEMPIGSHLVVANVGGSAVVVQTNAGDGITGRIANASADSVADGTLGNSLTSAATDGAYVKIVALTATQWYIVGGVGVWTYA